MSFVSYAQNFEDVLLHRVFGGQETGFYVDVGAYHPVNGSTTKAFYDRGWSGINIEPGSVFAELTAARPRDVNLQMAVMDRDGEIAFIEDEADRGTSHVVLGEGGPRAARMVPCDTLEAIVRAHSHGRPVDFVKVDAEGAEAAIVRSTDWRRLRPRVLLLEATLPWSSTLANEEWEPVLLEQGYVRAYFDGINCFYIPEEDAPALLRHFQVPVNVLDRAERHECEALRAQRDAIQSAFDERQTEVARFTSEAEALGAALDGERRETARLAAQRDEFRTALDTRKAEAERFVAERDSLRVALHDYQTEGGRLAAERDALRAALHSSDERIRELEPRLAPPQGLAMDSRRGAGRRLARRAAVAAYRLVRPVARPIAWRLRGFLVGGLSEQLRQQGERLELLSVPPPFPPPPVGSLENGAVAEMRRLAEGMESALLTLAMERAPETWPVDAGVQPQAEPTLPRLTLLLPHGRTAEVERAPRDLSVSAPIEASGGDWEPHVRSYLESVVRPDWVCVDIGANLGAHTLSLAVLAHEGRVVAFEADAANFALLSRNAGALAPPRAAIDPVHVALWDSQGTLIFGGADELAGCSFVVLDMPNHASVERQLRTVVNSDAIDGIELHMRLNEVPALPLDAWVKDNPLPRLDLIKLDVEGAEAWVIRGADATLRRHRPVLVVEYNPACAATYFGQSPDALFRELEVRFAAINALEPDGTLTSLAGWAALESRLAVGKGWEDLICIPGPCA